MKDLYTILTLSIEFLKKQNISRARLIAETLLAHVLGLDRVGLYIHFDRPLLENELRLFRKVLKRAGKNEPLDYILGEVKFFETSLIVNPSVLIPRQETEILLDLCCESIDKTAKTALDLCCGSGCLAIGLKKKYPHLQVTGVDLSSKALETAKENGKRNHLDILWFQGDLTKPLEKKKFDLVLCNPPYVSTEEYFSLDPEVKNYEPEIALNAGPTGYEFFERLEKELPDILNPGAQIFFEIGAGQGVKVLKLFSRDPWREMKVLPDWAGHDRFFCLKIQ